MGNSLFGLLKYVSPVAIICYQVMFIPCTQTIGRWTKQKDLKRSNGCKETLFSVYNWGVFKRRRERCCVKWFGTPLCNNILKTAMNTTQQKIISDRAILYPLERSCCKYNQGRDNWNDGSTQNFLEWVSFDNANLQSRIGVWKVERCLKSGKVFEK